MTASNEEISAYENYHDDEYDNINELNDFQENVLQQSPSLYHGCRFSTVTTLKMLMDFLISRVSLDKSNIINLMKLIKKILPIPNTLPISWKSIMKLFGKVNLSSTTFICSKYLNECEKTAFNTKNCTNDRCSLYKRTLKTNEIVEVVNLDVRTQLKSIITRNINLMKQNDDIEYLITNGTTFYINNVEYNFVVRTQFFLADLPAKALFLKTTSFNGSLTEIEAAADRLDKEMNTDLESDCEIVMNFDKSNASQELSQYSMVATPSSKSSIEIVGSSAIRKNKNQKEKENNPTGSTMRSLLMTSFDNGSSAYQTLNDIQRITKDKNYGEGLEISTSEEDIGEEEDESDDDNNSSEERVAISTSTASTKG
ncbi:unnamed protein product [Rotaria socialis]|uniref:Uncharacterized protein n=1 Tax=Rotaria socialis TaxID=392032 RepID=A0A817YPV8_9BILA|nr:unnamed protein product [Rotaria socialis]